VSNSSGITELARRKRLLVAESELTRQALKVDCYDIQASLAGVMGLLQSGRSVWRALAVAAPLASLMFARKNGTWRGLLKATLAGWQMFKRFQPVWTAFKKGREAGERVQGSAKPPEPPEAESGQI
jgi:hypothetical protein